jgi:S1-C subfamily serine protease
MGNSSINSKSEMMEFIAQHNPGDKITVNLFRDGQEITVPVKLANESENLAVVKDDKVIIHGATFEKASDSELRKFGLKGGYKITHLTNGLLASAGIRVGFIVVAIDRQLVMSVQDLKEGLTSKKGGVLIEGVYPNGMTAYYGIGL